MAGIDGGFEIDVASLKQTRDQLTRQYLRIGKEAVAETTKWLERAAEARMQQGVRGNLFKAFRSKVYPGGNALAKEPTGSVFVKGERSIGAIRFFTRLGRITGKDGGPVAIPLPAAGPMGKNKLLTPQMWEARTGMQLRPVQRPGKPLILVADQAVLSGRRQVARQNTARRRASGRGNMTIPIFVVLPYVDFKNNVSLGPLVDSAAGKLRDNFLTRAGRIG